MKVLQKNVIVSIRYSVYAPKMQSSWTIGQDTEDEYLARLFSSERMEQRQKYFQAVTLKSLEALNNKKPSDIAFKAIILTSTKLPQVYLDFLKEIERKHTYIQVIQLSPEKVDLNAGLIECVKDMANDDIFASVRLDDDDGLSNTFLHQIDKYLAPSMCGFVVSFAMGHGALLDRNGVITKIANYKWRFGSAGLAYVSTKAKAISSNRYSIYQCGNHTKTDEKCATISDARHAAFIRAFHTENDSKDKFEHCVGRVLTEEEAVNKLEVYGLA